MSYQNLKAEMKRYGITQSDVAELLGMSTNNASLKINGKVPFTMEEAWEIVDKFFPEATIDYLFRMSDERLSAGARR